MGRYSNPDLRREIAALHRATRTTYARDLSRAQVQRDNPRTMRRTRFVDTVDGVVVPERPSRRAAYGGDTTMTAGVPGVVSRYFELDADRDIDSIVGLFTEDATVVDEGETHNGRIEIHAWQTGPASRYTYATEVLEQRADRRGPLHRHRPPHGQLPRRHRRTQMGLHRCGRTDSPSRHRTVTP